MVSLINFPEILFELFKNNKHIISEGGIIREIMTRNGMNVPGYLTDKWLGLAFEFKDIRHLYDRLNISYANGNGTYLWDNGVKDYQAHLKFVDDLSNKLNITDNDLKSFLFANSKVALDANDFFEKNRNVLGISEWIKNALSVDKVLFEPFEIKSTGKLPSEISSCCPGGCCPDPVIHKDDYIIYEYGIKPLQSSIDGAFNVLAILTRFAGSNEWVGARLRRFMKEMGIDVPSDIDNKHLAELYELRKENGIIIISYKTGLLRNILGLGLNTIDVLAFLAPSKGGGAFLAVQGGAITTAKITQYLKVLAKGEWKTVSESMSDAAKRYQEFISKRKWNESFVLNGVKFDGLKNAVLSDAKSGMLNFVNPDGTFKAFFTGVDAIISQARRQRQAAGNLPIEWHFEHKVVRDAFENLLKNENLDIIFKHTPR